MPKDTHETHPDPDAKPVDSQPEISSPALPPTPSFDWKAAKRDAGKRALAAHLEFEARRRKELDTHHRKIGEDLARRMRLARRTGMVPKR
ncbi:MAG TPA: hypothetical protein VFR09_05305 [Alphaproteobacteria bacterium]|nr:hypothetical protein [Alphaproteobacteria bacterium]